MKRHIHQAGRYLRCQMELIEGNKVPLEQPSEETEVDPVRELSVQIRHFQVQLVQVLVYKGDKRFFHHLEISKS